MYVKDGELVLGAHDLDHLIGSEVFGPGAPGRVMPGSKWFLGAMDDSMELFLSGLVEGDENRPIEEQLKSLGVRRIVFELERVGVLNPDGSEMGVVPLTLKPKEESDD